MFLPGEQGNRERRRVRTGLPGQPATRVFMIAGFIMCSCRSKFAPRIPPLCAPRLASRIGRATHVQYKCNSQSGPLIADYRPVFMRFEIPPQIPGTGPGLCRPRHLVRARKYSRSLGPELMAPRLVAGALARACPAARSQPFRRRIEASGTELSCRKERHPRGRQDRRDRRKVRSLPS